MLSFLFVHASKLTLLALWFLAGETISVLDSANDHPAITAILAGALATVIVKYVDKWNEGRLKTIKTADKVAEIEATKAERLAKEQRELLADKEAYWKLQNDRMHAEIAEQKSFYDQQLRQQRGDITEARNINHKAVNYVMQQQNIILILQRELMKHDLAIPEVTLIEASKFLLPVTENDDIHTTIDREDKS